MHIVNLTPEQIGWVRYVSTVAEEQRLQVRVGYDEMDESIKWKLGAGPWSPPCKTEEQ